MGGERADDGVLIITGSLIGDLIMSTGAIAEIVRRHPGAPVTVVCPPATAVLFRHLPARTEVIPLAKKKRGEHWLELWWRLRRRRWARIYDFRNSGAGRFLNGPRSLTRRAEGIAHKVLEASSIVGDGPALAPVVWLTPAETEALPPAIRAAKRLLVIGPGATRIGKAWPVERFAALAARLTGPGGRLEGAVVAPTGGPMDRPAAAVIGAAAGPDRFVDMTGADLLTTAALMARADLFVGNDSGMMHLAAAAGAPTLGLFGPTDERLYGPWGERAAAVRAPGVDVVFGKVSKTVSPTENQMGALTVDEVAAAADRLLGAGR
ncbi:MAG: glycosyltransferase family 9 protein [Pseudomonadota bacterium]|nr:glycosyltransferase family 9 protein [Pseudomonadota bacterium]